MNKNIRIKAIKETIAQCVRDLDKAGLTLEKESKIKARINVQRKYLRELQGY